MNVTLPCVDRPLRQLILSHDSKKAIVAWGWWPGGNPMECACVCVTSGECLAFFSYSTLLPPLMSRDRVFLLESGLQGCDRAVRVCRIADASTIATWPFPLWVSTTSCWDIQNERLFFCAGRTVYSLSGATLAYCTEFDLPTDWPTERDVLLNSTKCIVICGNEVYVVAKTVECDTIVVFTLDGTPLRRIDTRFLDIVSIRACHGQLFVLHCDPYPSSNVSVMNPDGKVTYSAPLEGIPQDVAFDDASMLVVRGRELVRYPLPLT